MLNPNNQTTVPWFHDATEVIETLESNLSQGLNSLTANNRLNVYGKNELPEEKPTPFLKLVAKQFEDILVIILLAAAVISFILAFFEDDEGRLTAFVEPVVILLILIANASVGVIQETSAENAIKELKAYEAMHAVVLRDGLERQIAASDVVIGDIILVKVGEKVPADCRVVAIHSSILTVDQSILTGESDSVNKTTARLRREDFAFVQKSFSFSSQKTPDDPAVKKEAALSPANSLVDKPLRFGDDLVVNQDKTNMLFSGTLVTSGKAVAIVTSTGVDTAIGRIHSNMMEQDDEKTPLKIQLDEFGEQLSKLIGIICLAVWLINISHFNDPVHGGAIKGAIYYFKIAVALAVAAVPEGLPAVVTTCLALGTRQMAKEGAIVRSLPSVETLGCTSVICVDKTGTLTTNQMCVKRVLLFSPMENRLSTETFVVKGSDYTPYGSIEIESQSNSQNRNNNGLKPSNSTQNLLFDLARCCSLCNESKIEFKGAPNAKHGRFERIGEPTEAALKTLVEKIGIPTNISSISYAGNIQAEIEKGASDTTLTTMGRIASSFWESEYFRQHTLEFTRQRKSMGVICKSKNSGQRLLLVKGAPESVLKRCKNIKLLPSSYSQVLTEDMKEYIMNMVTDMANEAYRCLAIAEGDAPEKGQVTLDVNNPDHFEEIEQNLTLIGIVGMVDPTRDSAKLAVANCRKAGIRIIVLTGDNHNTAKAVCRDLGLLPQISQRHDNSYRSLAKFGPAFGDENDSLLDFDNTLSGRDWSALTPEEQRMAAKSVVLVSRVEPVHKLQIVKVLRDCGEVVAMTGDGVNDAPALKRADIGVAMGSGTAVAKEASDIILLDDNFATIVSAVRHGRAIFTNTKQFIRYLISSNIGEVGCIFFTAALGIPDALSPVQLLWVNFVTDGLPATALSFNKPEKDCMEKPPRDRKQGIVDSFTFLRYAIVGLYVGVAVVGGFIWWFMYFEHGPKLTWSQLSSFVICEGEHHGKVDFDCSVFDASSKGRFAYPSTIALSILVMIEMFNALNSLSDQQSLLIVPPTSNGYLIAAIILSIGLHVLILYTPGLASIFGVAPLSIAEWIGVLKFSFPVIIIDEFVKLYARHFMPKNTSNWTMMPKANTSWNIEKTV